MSVTLIPLKKIIRIKNKEGNTLKVTKDPDKIHRIVRIKYVRKIRQQ